MRLRGALIVLVVLIEGCAATTWPRGIWDKPGVSATERRRDEYECERQAVLSRGVTPPEKTYAQCMRERGYARSG